MNADAEQPYLVPLIILITGTNEDDFFFSRFMFVLQDSCLFRVTSKNVCFVKYGIVILSIVIHNLYVCFFMIAIAADLSGDM